MYYVSLQLKRVGSHRQPSLIAPPRGNHPALIATPPLASRDPSPSPHTQPSWPRLSRGQPAVRIRSSHAASLTSLSIRAKLRSIAAVRETSSAATASSSASSSCIRSRHASTTCEQPWPSNTP
ncbi:hypothetical protein SORBI_3003G139366 [Sorghum bicolor]|uniref:Uncharacterized protein n=1 Tax=Sorghum bicolor TaxID=4558 RepID=A0A1W0VXA5_SORBI|nr:hypothetical protein SORBI_3003G139366 [Sorghum bicolor]